MLFTRLKNCICLALATVLATGLFFAAQSVNACKLSAILGERTFYLDSCSSQSLRKTTLTLRDIPRVRGECVRFDFSGEAQTLVQEILNKYDAELLFCERAGGSVCYYAYSSALVGGVQVNGYLVNLHIAFNDTECAVGTPLIFDGF